jgi:uracil-DNA glycosylase
MSYDPRQAGALCDSCPLNWKRPVPPVGPKNAKIAIVGESPGRYEENKGTPFIGPSGMQLEKMLKAVGLHRSEVFLSNAILCRPELPWLDDNHPDKFSLKAYLAWVKAENGKRKKIAVNTGGHYDPIGDPIDCCAVRLWRELYYLEGIAKKRGDPNGLVVVPMGNYASKAVTGKQAGIMKVRGSPLPITHAEENNNDQ